MRIASLNLLSPDKETTTMASAVSARLIHYRSQNLNACLSDFQGVEHKLEFVKTIEGVDFINDSKSSNLNACWFALESMTKPVIWIAAATDDPKDYSGLHALVRDKVKAIIALGFHKAQLEQYFGDSGQEILLATDMNEAVMSAFYSAQNGDAILFSPAANSFEMYHDYQERGEAFKHAVSQL